MATVASLHLDQQLCFALYMATNAVTRLYRAQLGKVGLTYPQYLAMLVLWERGPQTVKGLADRLALDSSTLTPLLKRLEAAGLVQRERDSRDERVVRVSLTPAGEGLRQPVAEIQSRVVCQTRLSEQEFTDLRARLHSLVQAIAPEEQSLHEAA